MITSIHCPATITTTIADLPAQQMGTVQSFHGCSTLATHNTSQSSGIPARDAVANIITSPSSSKTTLNSPRCTSRHGRILHAVIRASTNLVVALALLAVVEIRHGKRGKPLTQHFSAWVPERRTRSRSAPASPRDPVNCALDCLPHSYAWRCRIKAHFSIDSLAAHLLRALVH